MELLILTSIYKTLHLSIHIISLSALALISALASNGTSKFLLQFFLLGLLIYH